MAYDEVRDAAKKGVDAAKKGGQEVKNETASAAENVKNSLNYPLFILLNNNN